MFAKSIVFVVGAGASHELGFPLGDGLKQEISTDIRFRFDVFEQTSGSRELFALIRRKFGRDTNSYIEAGNLLSPAMEPFPSVDEALHHFAGNERVIELGKLAIAMRIIAHERASSLPAFQDYETKFSLPAGGWLAEFLSMALSGTTLRDNAHIFKNVTIVNLNYDRSPEHFLLQALQHNAARSEELAIAAIRGLKILRPYGSIGPLQWQTSELERIPYGGSGDLLQSTLGAATNIRTFTEQLVDDQIRKEIVAALNTAQAVIFLGFGFHQQNMALLRASDAVAGRLAMATKKAINAGNDPAIKSEIGVAVRIGASEVALFDMGAAEFLQKLRPTIMQAVGKLD